MLNSGAAGEGIWRTGRRTPSPPPPRPKWSARFSQIRWASYKVVGTPSLPTAEVYTVITFVYPRIFCGEFSVFLAEPVPYTFVSVNRRNNEAMQCGPALRYSVDLRIQTYTEPVPLEIWKTPHKISVDIRMFLQCTVWVMVKIIRSLCLRLLQSKNPGHASCVKCPMALMLLVYNERLYIYCVLRIVLSATSNQTLRHVAVMMMKSRRFYRENIKR